MDPESPTDAFARRLTEHARSRGGPWTGAELRTVDAQFVAAVLDQEPRHELMALYARALNHLGDWLGDRGALDVVREARGSAQRLAAALARGMPFFDDRGFYKRAQITANDLALAGVAVFADIDELTVFADNVLPHVLRTNGVLVYDPELAATVDAGIELPRRRIDRTRAARVRATRMRAAGATPRRPAENARQLALEPRPTASVPRTDGTPHEDRLLLSPHHRQPCSFQDLRAVFVAV